MTNIPRQVAMVAGALVFLVIVAAIVVLRHRY
jgi:hypothetical protein